MCRHWAAATSGVQAMGFSRTGIGVFVVAALVFLSVGIGVFAVAALVFLSVGIGVFVVAALVFFVGREIGVCRAQCAGVIVFFWEKTCEPRRKTGKRYTWTRWTSKRALVGDFMRECRSAARLCDGFKPTRSQMPARRARGRRRIRLADDAAAQNVNDGRKHGTRSSPEEQCAVCVAQMATRFR